MATGPGLGEELSVIVEASHDSRSWWGSITNSKYQGQVLVKSRSTKLLNVGEQLDCWVMGWDDREDCLGYTGFSRHDIVKTKQVERKQ